MTKIPNEYDYEKLTVTRLGQIFPLADLPQNVRDRLALRGLGNEMSAAKDPAARYHAIKSGEATVGREPKKEELDPWRDAAAHVHAEATVRGRGIKAPPGKTIRATAEFLAELALAQKAAAGFSRAQLAEAKAHPDVVAEHGRITGKRKDLAKLFAGDAGEASLAQAAE